MVGANERAKELKREEEILEGVREAAKRWASLIGCRYKEPPLEIQYKVNARAGQVLQANQVTLLDECRKSWIRLLVAGKDSKEIFEKAKAFGLGKVGENYPVFEGSYKDSVNSLRKEVERLASLSLAFLFAIPDVPHDGDICRFADYVKGLKHFIEKIDEAFDLVDEIYHYLETSE